MMKTHGNRWCIYGWLGLLALVVAEAVLARGGGGARMSSARAGHARSLPANYGSMQASGRSVQREVRPAPSSIERRAAVDQRVDRDLYRGEVRSVETPRGGVGALGVAAGGALVARGETARGRDYAFAGSQDGDRIVVGQTASGEVAVRAKGDYDGVRYNLPDDYDTVLVGGYTYYHHGYDYYWPYYYGGTVYYQEIYPPVGVVTTNVPPGADVVVVDDTEFLVADGVYYQKDGEAYRVVEGLTDAAPAADQGPDPRELLVRMAAYLGSLSNFVVDCTDYTASPEKVGETISTKRRIFVRRPARIAAAAIEGGDQRRFWYDGQHATVYDLAKKIYASVDAPDTMPEAFDMLRSQYGLNLPLADLVRPDLAESILAPANTLGYAGRENIGEVPCHKLTLMNDELKGYLWLEADEQTPRPRKMDLLYYSYPGQPRYQVVIARWEAREAIDDNMFVFQPPADAARIEMVSRAGD